MKPVRRTIEMRRGFAYYRGKYMGVALGELDKAFNLPSDGKFRAVIKEGGPYKIVGVQGGFFFDISMNGECRGSICKTSFYQLFFKPDGRKRYSIQVKRL